MLRIACQRNNYPISYESGDQDSDKWGIPEWVAFDIRKLKEDHPLQNCPKWTTDPDLFAQGIAPNNETHTMLNARPQLQWQNNGIWKKLEGLCLDWADTYGSVRVICAPVFFGHEPAMWLGQDGEIQAAIPDAFLR